MSAVRVKRSARKGKHTGKPALERREPSLNPRRKACEMPLAEALLFPATKAGGNHRRDCGRSRPSESAIESSSSDRDGGGKLGSAALCA